MVERREYEVAILAYLTDKAGPTKRAVTLDSKLREDLGFDSLDGVETVQDLEEEYKVSIPDEVTETFLTGRDIVDYLFRPEQYLSDRRIQLKKAS